jgi:hypothetical protein
VGGEHRRQAGGGQEGQNASSCELHGALPTESETDGAQSNRCGSGRQAGARPCRDGAREWPGSAVGRWHVKCR